MKRAALSISGESPLKPARLAVLLSGRGSNFEAIADAVDRGEIPDAAIVAVISDHPSAGGLEAARRRRLAAFAVDRSRFGSRREHEEEIGRILESVRPDLICLAGYMCILSPQLVARYRGRILNIHPSLLPLYPGLSPQRKALEAGDSESGCTVHFVDEGTDSGAPVLSTRVPILRGDSTESLSARILEEEHRLYPAAISRVLEALRRGLISAQ